MKSKKIFYLIYIFLFSITTASCSEKVEDNVEPIHNEDGTIPVRLNIGTQAVNSDLTYTLHLFRKIDGAQDYIYWRTVGLQADNTKIHKCGFSRYEL
ncbi:MAG: hypothetical protein LBG19_06485 [Prevotellaceae bacterium]|nr:hypothetical protein [Prevotellaceae bacterium]